MHERRDSQEVPGESHAVLVSQYLHLREGPCSQEKSIFVYCKFGNFREGFRENKSLAKWRIQSLANWCNLFMSYM